MDKIEVAPIKPTISFKEFEKIDIRVGTIENVDAVEKADKLVKLSVNFGNHHRQILVLKPNALIGVKLSVARHYSSLILSLGK